MSIAHRDPGAVSRSAGQAVSEPPLTPVLTIREGDLAYYIPIAAITLVYEDPDNQWYVDVSGEPSFRISRETAVWLLGEGTIYNGPRPRDGSRDLQARC